MNYFNHFFRFFFGLLSLVFIAALIVLMLAADGIGRLLGKYRKKNKND